MAPLVPVLGLMTGIAGFAHGVSSSQKSQALAEEQWEFQQQAQKAQYESDISTYQYNIEQAEEDIGATTEEKEYEIGTFGRESEKILRGQREAVGASGATIGAGTPLDVMERTALEQEEMASAIEKSYQTKIKKLGLEKEFYGEQITQTESLLDELFKEPEEKKKKKQNTQYTSHW